MNLSLTCVVAHAAVPSFYPGVPATLTDTAFAMPRTPELLRRLAHAVRDRALAFGPGPSWEDIEADVAKHTAILDAKIAALAATRISRAS